MHPLHNSREIVTNPKPLLMPAIQLCPFPRHTQHCCYKFQKLSSIAKLKPAFNPFLFSESMTVKNVGEFQFEKMECYDTH